MKHTHRERNLFGDRTHQVHSTDLSTELPASPPPAAGDYMENRAGWCRVWTHITGTGLDADSCVIRIRNVENAMQRLQVSMGVGFACLLLITACGGAPVGDDDDGGNGGDSVGSANDSSDSDAHVDKAPKSLRVSTFNTGTASGMSHDQAPNGYTNAMAKRSDAYYGNGLAWPPGIAAVHAFFAVKKPDIAAFQEIFDPRTCPGLPAEATPNFICETWHAGDPSVVKSVLGEAYQVACNPGKSDKCIGVRKAFGHIIGCDDDDCLSAGVGAEVPGCGSGARLARFDIELTNGGRLAVLHVHGSSGLKDSDKACRTAQFEAGFALLQQPEALTADARLVLGDFNTDPIRFGSSDPSAARLMALVKAGGLHFHTKVGWDTPGTYAGVVSIDHVMSDRFVGGCWHALGGDHPKVMEATYFDHAPAVCDLTLP